MSKLPRLHNQSCDQILTKVCPVSKRFHIQKHPDEDPSIMESIDEQLKQLHEELGLLKMQTKGDVNYNKLLEAIDTDVGKELLRALLPQGCLMDVKNKKNIDLLTLQRLHKRLNLLFQRQERLTNWKNVVGQLQKISEIIRLRGLRDFKKKVDKHLLNINYKQEQLYNPNQSPNRMKYRDIVESYSVHVSRSQMFRKPIGQRIREMEEKCSRFSKINMSLFEQDHILDEAIRIKKKPRQWVQNYIEDDPREPSTSNILR